MTTDEIDLKKRVWVIPASRSKNKHEHKVPLSDLAVALIKEALADAVDDRVFRLSPHRTNKYVTNCQAKFSVRNWSAHDLRRTMCTQMVRLGCVAVDCRACGEPSRHHEGGNDARRLCSV